MDTKFSSDAQWFISPVVNIRAFKETAEEELVRVLTFIIRRSLLMVSRLFDKCVLLQQFTNSRMGVSDEYEPEQETLSSFLGCSSRTTSRILKDIS